MMVQGGWREQWDRVNRMLHKVESVYSGRARGGTAEMKDDVYGFFQNVHHLRDWVSNDPASGVTAAEVEAFVKGSAKLKICADLCNGSKHLTLTKKTWTDDPDTAITKVSAEVLPAGPAIVVAGGGPPKVVVSAPGVVLHQFEGVSAGSPFDVLKLAREGVKQWTAFLAAKGLI